MTSATPIMGSRPALPAGFTGLILSTPTHDGTLHHAHAASLTATTMLLAHLGIRNDQLRMVGDSDIAHCRDHIADVFLRSDYSHMLCTDADISWRPEDVLLLLRDACSHEFVMGAYPRKRMPLDFPVLWLPDSKENLKVDHNSGCVQIGGGPAGFMLLSKLVFKRLADLHPELSYRAGDEPGVTRTAFYMQFIEDGYRWSEDLALCRRWCMSGGSVWLDPRIDLKHWGSAIYAGRTMDLFTNTTEQAVPAQSSAAGG